MQLGRDRVVVMLTQEAREAAVSSRVYILAATCVNADGR
jgi:hypothetical protein